MGFATASEEETSRGKGSKSSGAKQKRLRRIVWSAEQMQEEGE